ncbi:YpiF family protein [Anaerobacillus sp. MEB173]|uniref:YpiF family protein n=1 Tax=Anaerobacillus sp. MEB173 TaxID=3383345 RepID=UPI003F925775
MKWQAEEIDTYLQSKEYVDTAVIPLLPISWKSDVKLTVSMGEFISIITDELERQFKGRIFMFPPFTYLKDEPIRSKVERLTSWEKELTGNGFAHIVYITSDVEWKSVETDLSDTLIWLPSIPLEHMDEKYRMQTVSDQIKQLIPIITSKWQNGPKDSRD